MATKFLMGRDVNGYPCYSLEFTDTAKSGILVQNIEQHFTVPSGMKRMVVVVEPGATVWVSKNNTAASPSGAIASSTSEMNPGVREVVAGDVISLITPNTTAQVGIQLYAV